MQEKRLAKLEAGLEGREKVLAWLHQHQKSIGFVDFATRRIETSGASVGLPDIEDIEAAFTYECWKDCNGRVIELQNAPLQKALFSFCILRLLSDDYIVTDEKEQQSIRQLVKLFVLQWMMLDRVVNIISEKHFSGMHVLYEDTAAILKKDLELAEKYLATFNVKIAPRIGVKPITSSELEECLVADAPRDAENITSLARVEAELVFGNRFASFTLMAKVQRGYESKAEDDFRQAMAGYESSRAQAR